MSRISKPVRKAVFPVAGMGTRFLPATKANPKEMLPIVDKPLIQYAAEEAVKAGIEVLIFVNGRSKRAIPDHFDKAYELEKELEARGKHKQLELVRNILPPQVSAVYIRQPEALGLGDAVARAQAVVGDEPFAVILADDLIDAGSDGVLKQLVDVYASEQCSVLGVEKVPMSDIHRYGVVAGRAIGNRLWEVDGIVEKPLREDAPSDVGVVGRYILTPAIFEMLKHTPRGAGGEIQLTDAIASLLKHERVLGCELEGVRYDCGDKLGYLKATIQYALKHPELSKDFRAYLESQFATPARSAS
ncbi:UTP--glucose-1-phosphate uridylyltransferase [Acidihalobacter yilgarnensis]|uniref:UTP--glucose-1-phosphate uridylyltransferase n=1 Tax=Acidihalobacter yilgarnensis TaxID=2819280 RepID=A0A1D8IME9_9GAMM|nr:UTP--glucose-1-phosphate uridylyltransferase GalU [Acidihalobacter yilgarnensis]AOU97638.1 UTP--glucose-1-phosphate uridylyltransferase [Acidihalobacter yilgarnensis]